VIQTDDQMLLAQQCIANLRRILLEARKVHSRQDYAPMPSQSCSKSSNASRRSSSISGETWNRGSRASVARANRVQPSNSRRRNWWQSPLCSHYFAAAIESTWIVFVFASSVPVTVTFLAANFSGVFWSLNA